MVEMKNNNSGLKHSRGFELLSLITDNTVQILCLPVQKLYIEGRGVVWGGCHPRHKILRGAKCCTPKNSFEAYSALPHGECQRPPWSWGYD